MAESGKACEGNAPDGRLESLWHAGAALEVKNRAVPGPKARRSVSAAPPRDLPPDIGGNGVGELAAGSERAADAAGVRWKWAFGFGSSNH